MDFFEVVKNRRSVRSLEKVEIPKEDIIKILESGRLAPSGRNIQPWEFIVIDRREIIEEFRKVQPFIGDASLIIGIIANPEESKYWLEDISASAENMLLAITALGYASCWVEGTLLPNEEWVKKLLKIPEDKRLIIILPVGKEKEKVKMPPKKDLSLIVHYNEYGRKFLCSEKS